MSDETVKHLSQEEADLQTAFNAARAERMAKYGLPRNFAVIGVIKRDKVKADAIAVTLEKALYEIDKAGLQQERHFIPSYAIDLLSAYQLNGWQIPTALVRILTLLVDCHGHERATHGFIERKAAWKALAVDLVREIIGENPRHIPLRELARMITERAREMGEANFSLSDRTLATMTADLEKVGWIKPEEPAPAPAILSAVERKRPTIATALDPDLSRLPRHPAK